jgi:hypothetical protein
MSEHTAPTEGELGFYYFGLYTVLRRYRVMTVLGWTIVFLGLASLPLSWQFGTPHGLIDTLLSLGTVVAGLAVVQQSVASLSSYLHVPFSSRPGAASVSPPAIQYIEEMMQDIDAGGWQEAYAAIAKLERMHETYDLPPLTTT